MATEDVREPHRFRKKPIQISLFLKEENIGIVADFEGETSSISRLGMGARVDACSMQAKDIEDDLEVLEGSSLYVEFHVPWTQPEQTLAHVEMVGPSKDARFRNYIGMTFEREVNLTRLVSGL